jgi:hypothetical protein
LWLAPNTQDAEEQLQQIDDRNFVEVSRARVEKSPRRVLSIRLFPFSISVIDIGSEAPLATLGSVLSCMSYLPLLLRGAVLVGTMVDAESFHETPPLLGVQRRQGRKCHTFSRDFF